MISKTIGYNGVHDIFRQTHMLMEKKTDKSNFGPDDPDALQDDFGSLCGKVQHQPKESRIHAEILDEFGNPELPKAHCQ